jgi:hypothetical protein
VNQGPPTVLALEEGIRYHAFLWDPSLGVKIDLGTVERPGPGRVIFQDDAQDLRASTRMDQSEIAGELISLAKGIREANLVAKVDITTDSEVSLLLRYRDPSNYIASIYSPREHALFLEQRVEGKQGPALGRIEVPTIDGNAHLTSELRGNFGIVSLEDGRHTYTSPIVTLEGPSDSSGQTSVGATGVLSAIDAKAAPSHFEVRASPTLAQDEHLERKVYDAQGTYRGELSGTPEWDAFGKVKPILLDAYRPESFPYPRDWILVLQKRK